MHSVLQDEWAEADPGRGERVGVQYLGKRSGENYDYHVWTVKVDRPEATPQEQSAMGGSDRPPQESERDPKSRAEGGAKETAPGFDGSDLYGEPASKQSGAGTSEDAGGESTIGDPNGGLPS
jgi:hypothetical protein